MLAIIEALSNIILAIPIMMENDISINQNSLLFLASENETLLPLLDKNLSVSLGEAIIDFLS